jgi:hypothetical protein
MTTSLIPQLIHSFRRRPQNKSPRSSCNHSRSCHSRYGDRLNAFAIAHRISTCMSICVSICMSICVSICMSICMRIPGGRHSSSYGSLVTCKYGTEAVVRDNLNVWQDQISCIELMRKSDPRSIDRYHDHCLPSLSSSRPTLKSSAAKSESSSPTEMSIRHHSRVIVVGHGIEGVLERKGDHPW